MKISIKRNLEIPEEVSNKFSFDYLKALVTTEINKIDALTSLISDDLVDEEYFSKAQIVYEIKTDEKEDSKNIAKMVREYTIGRLRSDRETLFDSLKFKLDYLKRWANLSSDITRERLMIEEEVVDYCADKLKTLGNQQKQLQNK